MPKQDLKSGKSKQKVTSGCQSRQYRMKMSADDVTPSSHFMHSVLLLEALLGGLFMLS